MKCQKPVLKIVKFSECHPQFDKNNKLLNLAASFYYGIGLNPQYKR
jgi:hypothetical protein